MNTQLQIGASSPLPIHHPGEDLLLSYAAGSLSEAAGLAVATHLALCPDCRRQVGQWEAIGGELLETVEPSTVSEALFSRVMSGIASPEVSPAAAPRPNAALSNATPTASGGTIPVLPEPLRSWLGTDLAGVRWSRVMNGVDEVRIPCQGGTARLLRIRSGKAMPRHTHRGTELTLVLNGAFADSAGHFGRGDFAATDGTVDHVPVADPGADCICLAVTDAPLRLTGMLGRLLNPFIRF
jgi:putative transcriptional regulator